VFAGSGKNLLKRRAFIFICLAFACSVTIGADVLDYGATSADLTDDAAAINAAIAACVGGEIRMPAGVYDIYSPITGLSEGKYLVGEGSGNTNNPGTKIRAHLADGEYAIELGVVGKSSLRQGIRGIYIDLADSGDTAGGINITASTQANSIEDVIIKGVYRGKGINVTPGAYYSSYKDVMINGTGRTDGTGISFNGLSINNAVTTQTLYNVTIGNLSVGIDFNNVSNISISGGFVGSNNDGFQIHNYAKGICFLGTDLENNTRYTGNAVNSPSISQFYIFASGDTTYDKFNFRPSTNETEWEKVMLRSPATFDFIEGSKTARLKTSAGYFHINEAVSNKNLASFNLADGYLTLYGGLNASAQSNLKNVSAQGNINSTGQYQTAGYPINYSVSAYASGGAYPLKTTPSLLDFQTNDPSIVIPYPGTWRIRAKCRIDYNKATFAANGNVTIRLRRTNNAPDYLPNGSTFAKTAIVTKATSTFDRPEIEVEYYTQRNDDVIQLWGSIDGLPKAGSIDVVEAFIIAERKY
jgi:hypothetical protein